MIYACPRCGGPVWRGDRNKRRAHTFLAGALFGDVYGPLCCRACGQIARLEFSPQIQRRLAGHSILRLLFAVGGTAVLAWLLTRV